MADEGLMDDLLSTAIDENKVTALVGSLESQLSSNSGKEIHKLVSNSSFNNNHIGGTASLNQTLSHNTTNSSHSRTPHTVVSVHSQQAYQPNINAHKTTIQGSGKNTPQIIGISSIINQSTQNNVMNRNNSISSLSVRQNQASSHPHLNNKQPTNTPSIRIVTSQMKPPISMAGINQNNSNSRFGNSTMSNTSNSSVTIRPQQQQGLRVNMTGASTAIHNLATIAAEAKPLGLPNGNNHLQSIHHKDGTVIVKSDNLKRDGNLVHNPVIHSVRHGSPIISSGPVRVSQNMNPNGVNIRTNSPQTQHVVIRSTVATTMANSSSSVNVVNASVSGTPSTLRPSMSSQIRPQQHVRVSGSTMRVAAPANIAPRQPSSQSGGTITIPHGAVLMRNETGQLVLVSAPQSVIQQSPSTNSTVTTLSQGNFRVQNVRQPISSTQAPGRTPGGAQTITIQPQGPQGQQLRGSATSHSSHNLHRPARPTMSVVGQPSQAIGHPTPSIPVTTSSTGPFEMNKAMMENVKKCKNFLSTLIKLACSQPDDTVRNVQALIQGLIDGNVEPERFTERLQQELQSSPQPYLVPFLKKSLPCLRLSMLKGMMTIEGVRPPPTSSVPGFAAAHPVQTSQTVATQQVITAAGTLTTRPIVAPGPLSQKIRPSLGPSSGKMTVGRQPQVTIAQGGNKVVVHAPQSHRLPQPMSQAQRLPLPVPHSQFQSVRPKMGSPRPMTSGIRPHRPMHQGLPGSGMSKSETSSPASDHRMKRKFESLKDCDEDINDVATMGGVNLSEESKNILATTNADFIGSQMRSCKDEAFLSASPLMKKIAAIAKKHGIDEVNPTVVNLISHATQEKLREYASKLSVIAEHRVEIYKVDPQYEVESETRTKLKFLEELDKLEKKRHEEHEREILLRAIKSRSKNEDPEQAKLKQKAKDLQQAEAEELRQKEANLTALAAIGPRKKRKLDFADSGNQGSNSGNSLSSSMNSSRSSVMRPRIKRVNMKDVHHLLESERSTRKSELIYKSFLK